MKTDKNFRFYDDEKIKQIAKDLVGNRIFCSDQVRNPNDLRLVFMVLCFLRKGDIRRMRKQNVVHFFEYTNKAGPRAVNGYPTFFSVNMLSRGDYMKMREYEDKLRKAMEAI